jgi:hypothetical protein
LSVAKEAVVEFVPVHVSPPLITPLEAAVTAALPPAPVPIFSEMVQPVIVHGLKPVSVDPELKSPLGTEIGVCACIVKQAASTINRIKFFFITILYLKLFDFDYKDYLKFISVSLFE